MRRLRAVKYLRKAVPQERFKFGIQKSVLDKYSYVQTKDLFMSIDNDWQALRSRATTEEVPTTATQRADVKR